MSYQALYRAWRPQAFQSLVGQPHVKQTLVHALERGQVAHAYLFCGPRGTGKTSSAKVLAKAVNCLHPNGVEPCNECEACRSITTGSSVDVEEIDAASNRGVDEIRQLRDKVQYAPTNLRRKVYIVDEVHMLTTEAFNALLKTLEEPPGHTLFILATTEPHKIPSTIISRCQRFDFRRIAPDVIVERLREVAEASAWTYEEDALWRLADAADGGMRDALGLLEQAAAYGEGHLTAESAAHVVGGVSTADVLALIRELATSDALAALQRVTGWYTAGKDPQRMIHDILQALRDVFVAKGTPQDTSASRQLYRQVGDVCSAEWLLFAVQKLGETYMNLRWVDQPRLALEAALMSVAYGVPVREPVAVQESPAPQRAAEAVRTVSASPPAANAVPKVASPVTNAVESTKAPSGRTSKVAAAAAGSARKMEVLQRLQGAASTETLEQIQSQWADLLQRVKTKRIQTHAWLTHGEPVLATADTVVLSFPSKIPRDAVMKQGDRQAIEMSLAEILGRDAQVLALLHTDWEAFQRSLKQTEPEPTPVSAGASSSDVVERAQALFGEELVEIRPEE